MKFLHVIFWITPLVFAEEPDFQMVLYPKQDKDERIGLLSETHRIKGSSQEVNKQPSVEFPYLSIYKGKEKNPFAYYTEYRPKLDRFYARQGEYFLKNRDKVRPLIPGFPDLDGGIHGHSGTYHKNGMSTEIRDLMDQGHVIQYIDGHGLSYGLFLDEEKKAMLIYDAAEARPRQLFSKAVVDYDNYRMSTARSAKVVGESRFELKDNGWLEQELHFHGHYRYNTNAVFSYRIAGTELLELCQVHGDSSEEWFSQHFFAPEGTEILNHSIAKVKNGELDIVSGFSLLTWQEKEVSRLLVVSGAEEGITILDDGKVIVGKRSGSFAFWFAHWAGEESQLEAAKAAIITKSKKLSEVSSSTPSMTKGSPTPQWDRTFEGKGQLARKENFKTPYVIDTLPVPIVNPYKSPMVLSGIAFDPDGNAFVSTMFGDVWKVTGISDNLEKVTWKRMIAGLNSPFGLTYHDGVLYVGDKAELIALHDLNDDDEFDFVERVNQGFRPNHRNVHAGAPRDSEGAFYYVTSTGVKKLHDDKSEHLSPPTRTAMGIGVTHEDRVWSAPQEGGWTPASAIFEHHDGDDVYRPDLRKQKTIADIEEVLDPALVYIPRGVDNSTGGFATVRSDRFGLLGDKMLNLSWGACSAQLVLRDKPEGAKRYQGAVIPLEGNYISGLRYGNTNPVDGQLYLVGHDGWGTYSLSDGSLQRLRYTGGPVFYPVGFRTYTNGIKLDFDEKLDEKTISDPDNFFVKQWNYIYSNSYGSPEYSVKRHMKEGHDVLTVKSTYLLKDGKSIFIEVPDIDPAMTVHAYGQLKGASQQPFELNTFMTALYLQDDFTGFPGYVKSPEKNKELKLPVTITGLKDQNISQEVRKLSTVIEADINDQLQFIFDKKNKKLLNNIKKGDSIIFKLKNIASGDGMAHNALVIPTEDTELIGKFCDTHSSTLEAQRNSYVPLYDKDMKKKVLGHSSLIGPKETEEFVYLAETAGKRTLICTFPGHWYIMRVNFEVK